MKKVIIFSLVSLVLWSCRIEKNKLSAVDASSQAIVNTEVLSILKTLKDHNHLPVEERVALFYQLRKETPAGYDFENEADLNIYGYSLLWDGKVTDAIAIFKLVVAEFPNSSNAYDSLGEAYLANDDKQLSLVNYEKSLALDASNFNAEDQIDRIKFPDKVPETPAEKFVKTYSAQAYKDDLDQLGKRLAEVHPNVFKFISEEDFWLLIEEKKSLVTDQMTFGEFMWECREIIASVNCSHTSVGRFNPENEMLDTSLTFPLQTRWINDRLFVIDPLDNAGKVALKDEILAINERPVFDLMRDIYKRIPSQGYVETTKKHFFNTWSAKMIPYALDFPTSYTIRVQGKENPIVLDQGGDAKAIFRDPSIVPCEDNLCLEILEDSKTAVMTISSFNYYPWNNLTDFQDFADNSFKEIEERGIENLIIDVRFNGGGSSESSIHLLRYLIDEAFIYFSVAGFEGKQHKEEGEKMQIPFENRFTGKCYFIIDGRGNSTTGHFMSMVKKYNLGTIVGEELGSNQFCSAGQTICRLANTKLLYYVANNTHITTATSLPDEKGILPDHYVTQSIDDYLNKVDAVKAYTIGLLEE